MNERQRKLIKKLGLSEEDFEKSEMTTEELAENAYLLAEYNNILIEMLMEE